MKKAFPFACLIVLAFFGCVDTASVVVRNPDLTALADGVYEGEAKVGPVTARVRIEIAASSKAILKAGQNALESISLK
jgi:uncharacterized protein with FMN-binding domain